MVSFAFSEVADEVIEFKDDVAGEPQIAAVDNESRRETIEFDFDEDFNFDIIDSADIEEERPQSSASDRIQTSATENAAAEAEPGKKAVNRTDEESAETDDEKPTGDILATRRLIEAELESINRRLGYFQKSAATTDKTKTKTSPANSGCVSETERVSLTENQSDAGLRDETESLSSKSSASSSSSTSDGREWRYRSRAQPQTNDEKTGARPYIAAAVLSVSSSRRHSGRRRSRSRSRRRHRSPMANRNQQRSRSRHRHDPRSRSKDRPSIRRSGRSRSRSPRRRRSRPSGESSPKQKQKRKDEEKQYSKAKRVTGSNAVPLGARVGLSSAVVLPVPEQVPPHRKFIEGDNDYEALETRRHSGSGHVKHVAASDARAKVNSHVGSQKSSLADPEPVTLLKSLPLPSNKPRIIRIKPKKHQRPATVDQPNDFSKSDLLKITVDAESGKAYPSSLL